MSVVITYQPNSAINDINSYQYQYVPVSTENQNLLATSETEIPNNTILIDPEMRINLLQQKANEEVKFKEKNEKLSFDKINNRLSNALLDILDDFYTKPDNINWFPYISQTLQKDDRFTYLGIFLLILALFISLIR
jgi:hypothetical protein